MSKKEKEKTNWSEPSEREIDTGLSRAYALRAHHHKIKADKYDRAFSKGFIIVLMFIIYFLIVAFAVFMLAEEYFGSNTININNISINNYLLISSLLLSLIGALIWLGTYYKNREREERILEEEYSHKETLVIFFEEYSLRIKSCNEKEGEDALLNLHKYVVDSAAYNPSIRLGKENSDHPTIKILNKLIKVVDRVYDIPRKERGESNSDQSNQTKAG